MVQPTEPVTAGHQAAVYMACVDIMRREPLYATSTVKAKSLPITERFATTGRFLPPRESVTLEQPYAGGGILEEILLKARAAMIIPTIMLFHNAAPCTNPSTNGERISHMPNSTLIQLQPD